MQPIEPCCDGQAVFGGDNHSIECKKPKKVEYDEDDRDRPLTQRDLEIGDWIKGWGR